ncbi:MAG TPA: phosphoribosylanthranilate isomerase [Acetobacteraceae bacterium]|nr:phosphoribosylanthranilate isomerase [Acetobacteraceae bacterium]
MAKVKICGVNAADALEAATEAGADWVGLVFYPPSPRALTPAQAASLHAAHPAGPPRVGLFVRPLDDEVEAALEAVPLAALQVYAEPERVAALRKRFGLPVWHPIGIRSQVDLPRSLGGIDALLLEAQPPKGAALPGGNALRFEWSLLRGWAAPGPWLLAGGLTPENVAEAIRTSGAPAVDVSSGVERARGVKDPALIRAFVHEARNAR